MYRYTAFLENKDHGKKSIWPKFSLVFLTYFSYMKTNTQINT